MNFMIDCIGRYCFKPVQNLNSILFHFYCIRMWRELLQDCRQTSLKNLVNFFLLEGTGTVKYFMWRSFSQEVNKTICGAVICDGFRGAQTIVPLFIHFFPYLYAVFMKKLTTIMDRRLLSSTDVYYVINPVSVTQVQAVSLISTEKN